MSTVSVLPELLYALAFAAEKHRDQRRKDVHASPYINHPIEVARILAEIGGVSDIDTLRGGILHDTLEDTETTPAELVSHFGLEVCNIVQEVTDDKNLPKETRKTLQITNAAHASYKARLVKLADKTTNLRDLCRARPQGWSDARVYEYFQWAKAVVDGIRGTHLALETAFDAAYAECPVPQPAAAGT
jgi:guanosine-3',5'-bis(diphosphate) 3'-pyrophosphohydrolase